MWKMLQQNTPQDYILSSGKKTTVREFAKLAGNHLGMNLHFEGKGINERGIDKNTGKIIIEVNPKFFRKNELHSLVGDNSKAKKELRWNPKTTLQELISIMIEHDLKV